MTWISKSPARLTPALAINMVTKTLNVLMDILKILQRLLEPILPTTIQKSVRATAVSPIGTASQFQTMAGRRAAAASP
jgi:hypothetical protein